MFVQNCINLSAVVYELSCSRRNSEKCLAEMPKTILALLPSLSRAVSDLLFWAMFYVLAVHSLIMNLKFC